MMMEQLGITSIRQGANGRDPNAPNAANYDEAKGNPYPELPDALKLDNGKPVKSAKQWWSKRRPQIVEHFDREVYGRMPKHVPGVSWAVAETKNETKGGIEVVTRKLLGHVDNSAYPLINVDIELYLTTPVGAKGVPVIIEFFPPEWAARIPPQPSPSWQEQVIARGWAYAILSPTSIQADNGAGLTRGIIGLVNKGQITQARRLGRVARLGVGRVARARLPGDRSGGGREARRHRRRVALRQGVAGDDGVRAALRHRFHRLIGHGRRRAASPAHRRTARERRGQRRISLDGGQLHQVRRSAHREGSARGCARAHRARGAAAAVHRRRQSGAG